MAFRSSLVCSAPATVERGDVVRFQYSDDVHQTPYGYLLLARTVIDAMASRGWADSDDRQ
jgi:hypothetical protein